MEKVGFQQDMSGMWQTNTLTLSFASVTKRPDIAKNSNLPKESLCLTDLSNRSLMYIMVTFWEYNYKLQNLKIPIFGSLYFFKDLKQNWNWSHLAAHEMIRIF